MFVCCGYKLICTTYHAGLLQHELKCYKRVSWKGFRLSPPESSTRLQHEVLLSFTRLTQSHILCSICHVLHLYLVVCAVCKELKAVSRRFKSFLIVGRPRPSISCFKSLDANKAGAHNSPFMIRNTLPGLLYCCQTLLHRHPHSL